MNDLPLGLKATKKQERFPLGDALVIIEERPLWPPGEAITWYKHGNNLYGHPEEDMHIVFTGTKRQKDAITYRYRDSKGKISYKHRLRGIDRIRGRIDIDIFNVAIELKVFKNQVSIRDLLAECL